MSTHTTAPKVVQEQEGVYCITLGNERREGDIRVTVGWDAEEGYWRATASPIPLEFGHELFGYDRNSSEGALQDLVCALVANTHALVHIAKKDPDWFKRAIEKPFDD